MEEKQCPICGSKKYTRRVKAGICTCNGCSIVFADVDKFFVDQHGKRDK